MTDAGEFVDAALQREGDWYRGEDERERLGVSADDGLRFYGASVGAVRGTVRDAGRKFPGLGHDEVTALSSELWSVPVYERRLAAVVLLQSHVRLLRHSDLTRIEGFLRDARVAALADPLARDVVRPLLAALDDSSRSHAMVAVARWAVEANPWLRRAAGIAAPPEA